MLCVNLAEISGRNDILTDMAANEDTGCSNLTHINLVH